MQDITTTAKWGQVKDRQENTYPKVLEGEQVLHFLQDKQVRHQWDALYQECPWATVFQSLPYIATWYNLYLHAYTPVLVIDGKKDLITGVLALALGSDGVLVGAGAEQAEYQVWLTEPMHEENFVKEAFRLLFRHFPARRIKLKYIPGKASVSWASEQAPFNRRCIVKAVRQPLMMTDESYLDNELRKKNRKEKINRLKRLGELGFTKVTCEEEFGSMLDSLALLYDFRKEAMYNRNFFQKDIRRKRFLISLFRQGLLHVTVLKVGSTIIASNAGLMGKGWVHLQGINTHDPLYAKHSPGILHFLFLGKELAKEGVDFFDLTPGGDEYKSSLATTYATAYELNVLSGQTKFWHEATLKLREKLKSKAVSLGVKPQSLRGYKKEVSVFLARLSSAQIRGAALLPGGGQKAQAYLVRSHHCTHDQTCLSLPLEYCSIQHLMGYDEGASALRWEFLSDALRRLETGERCLTWCQDGILMACAWLHGPKTVLPDGFPEEAQLIQSLYLHRRVHNRSADLIRSLAFWTGVHEGKRDLYILMDTHRTAWAKSLLQACCSDCNAQHSPVNQC